jgi:predicted acetyltransferase
VSIEIRIPADDAELRRVMRVGEAAFGDEQKDEDFERHRRALPPERFLGAYDDGRPIGTAAAYRFDLTVPGGEVPAAGVTWVGVLPSHRRRGVLTELMRRQLADAHDAGESIAILWASESAIYGRFGYGIAAPNVSLDAERARFRFRDDPGATGRVRIVDAEEGAELFPPVYERVRRDRPGMVRRTPERWSESRLVDPEHWRRGAGPKFYAVIDVDGGPEAYAIYRIKQEWEEGIPRSQLRVVEAIATSPAATRELWRFLFGIDLIARVQYWHYDPASPLFLMVDDPRSLHLRLADGLWLRLVDVEAALRARTYAADDAVVLELRDDLCPWNAGRWRVGAEVARTDEEPDLALDVRDLACAYLGAFDFHRLAAAGLARELRPGALDRASALFRTTHAPYCADDF